MGRARWVVTAWLGWSLSVAAAASHVCAQEAVATPEARAQPALGVVAIAASDEPVLSHLQNMLGYPTRRYPSALATDRSALLETARADGQQQLVIVDGGRSRVEVIRVADGSVLQRELPSEAERSPYAVAFAGAELLQLSMQPDAAADTDVAAPDGPVDKRLGVVVTAGAELRCNADLLYVRPALELGLSVYDPDSELWLLVAARAALLGSESHTDAGQRIDLSQQDLSVGFGIGLRGPRLGLLALVRGGFSVVAWELAGTPESADTQLRGWLGGALRGQLNLVRTLGLFVEAGLAVTPLRTRYIGPEGVLLEPGRVDAVVGAGLAWDTSD